MLASDPQNGPRYQVPLMVQLMTQQSAVRESLGGAGHFSSSHFFSGWKQPEVVAFALGAVAVALDYLLAPGLTNITPALAFALAALLLSRTSPTMQGPPPWIGFGWRLSLFTLLHLAALGLSGLIHRHASGPSALVPSYTAAFAGYLPALPVLTLLSFAAWRRMAVVRRSELLAGLVALLTIYPYRLVATLWPWYSQALGISTLKVAGLFVSGLGYISSFTPTVTGPHLDVTILLACSGLSGVELLQVLFALFLVMDWPVLNRRRALIGYFAGLALVLLANLVRIILMVVIGNLSSPHRVVEYHMTAGWLYFTVIVSSYLVLAYGWLMGGSASSR